MIGTNFGIYRPSAAAPVSAAAPTTATTSFSVTQPTTTTSVVTVNHVEERPQGQLSDFILQLEDYNPTIPDPVTSYYLNTTGFESNDPRIVRLVSIAMQKYISDVATAALQHSKTRSNNQQGVAKVPRVVKDRKYTLTMEDLMPALADYGVTVRKAQYFP